MDRPVICYLWGCGESVKRPKLDIQEVQGVFVLSTKGRTQAYCPFFGIFYFCQISPLHRTSQKRYTLHDNLAGNRFFAELSLAFLCSANVCSKQLYEIGIYLGAHFRDHNQKFVSDVIFFDQKQDGVATRKCERNQKTVFNLWRVQAFTFLKIDSVIKILAK